MNQAHEHVPAIYINRINPANHNPINAYRDLTVSNAVAALIDAMH